MSDATEGQPKCPGDVDLDRNRGLTLAGSERFEEGPSAMILTCTDWFEPDPRVSGSLARR